jgi:DNA-binding HxlR family transcriptional regulator
VARYPVRLAPAIARYAEAPLAKVLGILVRRWAVLTLEALRDGDRHFNQLQRSLDGITHKVLIDTLRGLQQDGLVRGPLTDEGMAEYRLTSLGTDLIRLVEDIRRWGDHRSAELLIRHAASSPPHR